VPAPGDYDYGEIGGMIGRGNRNTRRKPAPVPLCPPQTPHAVRTRTRAAEVGSQRLTAELRHGLSLMLLHNPLKTQRTHTACSELRLGEDSCGQEGACSIISTIHDQEVQSRCQAFYCGLK
jgi:hypothetical protein